MPVFPQSCIQTH